MNTDFPTDPREALEASLTALLLDELPTNQAAFLRDAIARDPELAQRYQRLKHTIDLVRITAKTPAEEITGPSRGLKLSQHRREELLQHFKTVAPGEFTQARRSMNSWLVPVSVAAVLIAVCGALLLPALSKSKARSMASARLSESREMLRNFSPPSLHLTHGIAPPAAQQQVQSVLPATPSGRELVQRSGTTGTKTQIVLPPDPLAEAARTAGQLEQHEHRVSFSLPQTAGELNPLPKQEQVPGPPEIVASGGGGLGGGGPAPGLKLAYAPGDSSLAAFDRSTSYRLITEGPGEVRSKETGQTGNEVAMRVDPTTGLPVQLDPTTGLPVRAGKPVDVATAAPSASNVESYFFALRPSSTIGRETNETSFAQDGRTLALNGIPSQTSATLRGFYDLQAKPANGTVVSAPQESGDQTITIGGRAELTQQAQQFNSLQPAPSDMPQKRPRFLSGEAKQQLRRREQELGRTENATDDNLRKKNEEQTIESSMSLIAKADSLKLGVAELDKGPKDVEKKQSFVYEVSPPVALAWSAEQTTANVGFLYSLKNFQNGLAGTTGSHMDQSFTFSAPGDHTFGDWFKLDIEQSKEARLAQLQVENRGYNNYDTPLPKSPAASPIPQPEILTRENAFSTFSLNVSDVSFKLAAASLEKGAMPDPAAIRVEEFINAFEYRDPEPGPGVPIGFTWERAQYPFAQNRGLLRFSLKTAAQGRQASRPLNLVLLLDNSGSMERADRVAIIREALRVLAAQLQPQDTFSVVTFARTAHLWVDGISGNQAGKVAEELSGLTPQGGTNLEEAMNLAYQTALRHYLPNGVNRVVLLTDGAANLGNVDPETLKQKVETNRKQGIAFDCFGIGWEGYNDDLLEVLTRNGDGRYSFINTPEEAASGFANQLAGALHVAAADVKVQVEFNPNRVTAYRQIGYAKHQLTKEQFRDNTVDAAELGAAESGNALYAVEINPSGEGPIATVRVRYKVPGTTEFHEHEWPVPYTGSAPSLQQSSPALRLAATASAFGEWLSQSPYATEVTSDALLGYLNGVAGVYGADTRPKTLEWMIRQAKSLSGK